MDSIEAIKGLSPHMGETEHLALYVNGRRLDEILAEKVDKSYLGLISAWLDFYDDGPGQKEKRYVWQQTALSDKPTMLPILLCPDDFDFSCTVIVAEVVCRDSTVTWMRLGADVTPFDAAEQNLPPYIGKKIEWFAGIGPYIFTRQAYLSCISRFAPCPGLG